MRLLWHQPKAAGVPRFLFHELCGPAACNPRLAGIAEGVTDENRGLAHAKRL